MKQKIMTVYFIRVMFSGWVGMLLLKLKCNFLCNMILAMTFNNIIVSLQELIKLSVQSNLN